MTERDIRMAVYQECAELADEVSRRYGNLPRYGAGRVAEAIRERMQALVQEPPRELAPVDEEPLL